jgi:hypothetical protein
MIYNLVRKSGIPVLASPASDAAPQWPCSLAVKYLETRMQATISLQCSLPIHGSDDEQTFTLLYNADNLVPGNTSLKPPPTCLPQDRLHDIARQGNANLKILSLTLKTPCSVWCPPSSGPIAPKDGFGTAFGQFVELARTTEVHILFDWNWLHKDHHARFDRLVRHPEHLTGIPVDQASAKRYRLADWSVFSPADDVASEAPPPYTAASKKRPRQVTTSPTPGSSPKRALLSPAPFLLSSPTEKATTASVSAPSPKSRLSSPASNAPDLQDSLKNVVEELLPQMLHAILPDMLPRLFAAPSPSPSPSRPRSTPRPKRIPMSSLGNLLSAHATAQLEAQLEGLYAETLDHATEMHSAADVEFHEILEEQKLDVAMIKEDSIVELNKVFDDKLAEFKESTVDMVNEMEKRMELIYAGVCDRLDGFVTKQEEYLSRGEELEKRRDRSRINPQREVEDRSRRAVSLPL